MRTLTVEVPDQIASILESMSKSGKNQVIALAALMADSKSISLSDIFAKVDKRMNELGLTEKEIEAMINDVS
ncbi:MAG: hypothetical protein ACK5DD_07490 [Cyclobacteriaceae bacterium]